MTEVDECEYMDAAGRRCRLEGGHSSRHLVLTGGEFALVILSVLIFWVCGGAALWGILVLVRTTCCAA